MKKLLPIFLIGAVQVIFTMENEQYTLTRSHGTPGSVCLFEGDETFVGTYKITKAKIWQIKPVQKCVVANAILNPGGLLTNDTTENSISSIILFGNSPNNEAHISVDPSSPGIVFLSNLRFDPDQGMSILNVTFNELSDDSFPEENTIPTPYLGNVTTHEEVEHNPKQVAKPSLVSTLWTLAKMKWGKSKK